MHNTRMLRSVKGILEKIPFNVPFLKPILFIDPKDCSGVPAHIKQRFNITFIYKDNIPFDGACSVVRDDKIFTVIIILNRKFEQDFESFLEKESENLLKKLCYRKELYCHEVCHLLAIIQACPNNFSNQEGIDEFVKKITHKFSENLVEAIADFYISLEKSESNPCDFSASHFAYADATVNYADIFFELMVDDKNIKSIVERFINTNTYKTEMNENVFFSLFDWFCEKLFISERFIKKFSKKMIPILEKLIVMYNSFIK